MIMVPLSTERIDDFFSDALGLARKHSGLSDWFVFQIFEVRQYPELLDGITLVRIRATAERYRKGGKSFTEEKRIGVVFNGLSYFVDGGCAKPVLVRVRPGHRTILDWDAWHRLNTTNKTAYPTHG